ncbi:helix-turn-helix domain-containing protein [Mesorhizobium sp. M1406]|uniref:helix-turn-helix domain-containing protein n=1 Tax=Mesorhizobium sp. M1406 TaxID=2957099 RepID=UPI0033383531
MKKSDNLPPAGSDHLDARDLRLAKGMTQQAFADTFGFTVGALRDWEQGRKRPERSARILLAVIQAAPEAVAAAVAKAGSFRK